LKAMRRRFLAQEAKCELEFSIDQERPFQRPKLSAKASAAARSGAEYSSIIWSSPSRMARSRVGVRADQGPVPVTQHCLGASDGQHFIGQLHPAPVRMHGAVRGRLGSTHGSPQGLKTRTRQSRRLAEYSHGLSAG